MADLADSAMALRTIARQLPDEGWQVPVRILDSAPFPADQLLTRRLVEVELHHCARGRVRPGRLASRLRRPGPSRADAVAACGPADLYAQGRTSGANPAARPYRPNQRLPGSWLGTR